MPREEGGGALTAPSTTPAGPVNLGGVSSTLASALSLQTLLAGIPQAQNPPMTPYSFSIGGQPAVGMGSQPQQQGQGLNLGLQPLPNMSGQARGNQAWQIFPANPTPMFNYPSGAINIGGYLPPRVVDPRSEEARLMRAASAQVAYATEYLSRTSSPYITRPGPDVFLEPDYGYNTAARGYPFGGGPTPSLGGGGGGGGTVSRTFGGGRAGTNYNPMLMGLINWRI